MTDVTPLVSASAQVVQAYTARGFRLSNADYLGAVLITDDKVLPLDVQNVTELKAAHFDVLKSMGISYLIIGSGVVRMLDTSLVKSLKEIGIVAEIMEIGAACRTYNVLRTEGRKMAAALIPAGAPV